MSVIQLKSTVQHAYQPQVFTQTQDDQAPLFFANPNAQYLALRSEIDAAMARALEGMVYILGPEVSRFESEFAAYVGADHCVGVANGTDALHLGLRALGVGAGDEVITTAHTAIATVAGVGMSGATPVFADIGADHYNLDPAAVEAAITERTKAIVVVHLYGHTADLAALSDIAKRRGLYLVEDCAQAHAALWRGRMAGSIGHIGCFSFYPTKNLGALGDGGGVVTSDPKIADRLRLLRQYGWRSGQLSEIQGFNSRLDELQAAVLRVKLSHLDEFTARRRAIAARYSLALEDLPLVLPREAEDCAAAFHLYVVRTPRRDALRAHLAERGVMAGVHYPVPGHKHPAYLELHPGLSLPNAEAAAAEVLTLPIWPEMNAQMVDRVIEGVRSFAW